MSEFGPASKGITTSLRPHCPGSIKYLHVHLWKSEETLQGEDEHNCQQLDLRASEDQFRSPKPQIWRLVPYLRGCLNPLLSPLGTLAHPAWLGALFPRTD